jgi:NAD(P)-dependent dehydrogenase (short-subunit alcohol dehydrogenase family)
MNVLETFAVPGRVAVVTGGNRGLGRAFAHALGEAGAKVAIVARDDAASARVVEELAGKGVAAAAFTADVTDRAALAEADERISAELGPVDVLVNNAGTCIHRPALEVTEAEWGEVVDTNLTGVWNGCQIFGAGMVARRAGTIVNVGSISAEIVNRPQWQPAYNASKAAVHHLTKSLAAEWAPLGVRVNAVAPGYVRTAMTPIDRPEFAAHWIGDTPQQRAALPEEIAPAVLFLASPASGFMTGAVLVIDGGYTVF